LVGVPIEIADYRASVRQASVLQSRAAQRRTDDNSLLLILTGEHLADGIEQAAQESLGPSWLAPESQR
jgi:hypothetical protein